MVNVLFLFSFVVIVMSNYNLYVVGIKSYLHNVITVLGVFPNDKYALNYKNVFFPKAEIYVVPCGSLKIGDCGLDIPFSSVKIK